MIFLRSLIFNLFMAVWSVSFLTLCLPVLMGPPRGSYWVGKIWARVIFVALDWLCNLRFEIRGRENLPPGPCLIAAKHQSMWDTMVFTEFMVHPSFVLKRELLRLPLYGWYVKHSQVAAIDRTGGAQALKQMVRDVRAILDAGRSLIIFPEGTRVPPGKSAPYHPGVAALYSQIDVPVVPVVLNSGLFWPKGAFLKKPGTIVMQILPPMPPDLDRRTFMAELQNRIETASAALPGSAVDPLKRNSTMPTAGNKDRTFS